jgi:energy-coupling factor transport system substrate-specific component
MALGVALYAGISWLTNVFPMSAAQSVDIRPGVVVPIFFGLAWGPVVGFVTGMAGNFLGDLVSGRMVYPPDPSTGNALRDFVQGTVLNWQFGNGLMGLIPGLALLSARRYPGLRGQARALLFTFAGVIVGMGFAAFTDIPLGLIEPGPSLTDSFMPVVRVNLINAVVLVPILLFNYERFDLSSTDWLHSGLMRRLLLAILISAALPVALLGLFLTQQAGGVKSDPTELTVKIVATVMVTMLFTIANAGLLAQSISRPLLRLTRAAQVMESGQLSGDEAASLEQMEGADEIGRLGQVFGRMAQEVIVREERLRRQVEQLRIEIDESKKTKQVEEITETDYFQTLRLKAREFREKSAT